jgi:hypothetical protein
VRRTERTLRTVIAFVLLSGCDQQVVEPGLTEWAASPSLTSRTVDSFYQVNTTSMFHGHLGGASWGTADMGLGMAAATTPAAVARHATHMDVFFQANTRRLWHSHNTGSGWVSEDTGLGMAPGTSPAAVSWEPSRVDAFFQANTTRLWHIFNTGSGWVSEDTGLGMAPGTSPAAVSWGPNRLDVFFNAAGSNRLWHIHNSGSGWHGGQIGTLRMAGSTSPAAVSWAPHRLDVFFAGAGNNSLWHAFGDAGAMQAEDLGLGMRTGTSPVAVSWGPNRLDVLFQANTTHHWHVYSTGAGWQGTDLGFGMAAGVSPAAVARDALGLAQATNGAGWRIYEPPAAPGIGYRYGPSIIADGGGTHMWTAAEGRNGTWDTVRYRWSGNGGRSWTADQVALRGTPGSIDAKSVCDPGAVKIGRYYYIAYTATPNEGVPTGCALPTCHPGHVTTQWHLQIAIARSTSPRGPFQKWNGTGWGGAPAPIVAFGPPPYAYHPQPGVLEPSLVLALGKIWLFYSRTNNVPGAAAGPYTDIMTANDPNNPNWPAQLASHGHAFPRLLPGEDSTDIKWVDALGRFVGVATYDRMTAQASVVVYQSYDGFTWTPGRLAGLPVQAGAHNIGISGNGHGHITTGMRPFISYAYQPPGYGWARWPTYLAPVNLDLTQP